MNRAIAHHIKDIIADQHYAGVVAGIVTPVKQNKAGKVLTYAIDCGVHGTDCEDGDLTVLVPDASKKSIFYFEDTVSPTVVSIDGQKTKMQCTLTLIGWLNLQLLGLSPNDGCSGCSWSYKIYSHLLTLLPPVPFNLRGSCPLSGITIQFKRQVARTADVFNRYTFGEEHRNFRVLPYDFFAIELLCTWNVNQRCIGDVPENDPFTCWPPNES